MWQARQEKVFHRKSNVMTIVVQGRYTHINGSLLTSGISCGNEYTLKRGRNACGMIAFMSVIVYFYI